MNKQTINTEDFNEVLNKEITKNKLRQVAYINANDDAYDRAKVSGFLSASQRESTPLMIFPAKGKFQVCHMIPYKYSGREDDTMNMFGASSSVNQAMRDPEKYLDEIISSGHDAIYIVEVNVNNDHILYVHAYVFDRTLDSGITFIISDDNNFYVTSFESPKSKSYITEKINTNDNQSNKSTNHSSAFSKQWNEYKETITLESGRQIEGVQMTYYTFVDIYMNKYNHKNDTTINEKIKGKNWIFSQYLLSLMGMNNSVIAYIENYEDKLILNIVEDTNNNILNIQQAMQRIQRVLDLTEIKYQDPFTYELYRRSHSRLFHRTWELQENEFSYLDEETMKIYPVEKENGQKGGFEFRDTAGMLITGTSGSGKTESVKNMLMSFIQSKYVDVGIIDMKASNDWAIFEPYINILINNNVKVKGAYYIRLLEKEINHRYKMLKEKQINNIWELSKDERPFNFKVVIIDELQELASGNSDRWSNEYDGHVADVMTRILKKARAVGIFIIGITQTADAYAIDRSMLKQFHHKIALRNMQTIHLDSYIMEKKVLNIPKTREGIGVAVSNSLLNTSENEYPLVRFGYYKNEIIKRTLSKLNEIDDYKKEKITTKRTKRNEDDVIIDKHILNLYENLKYQPKNESIWFDCFEGKGLCANEEHELKQEKERLKEGFREIKKEPERRTIDGSQFNKRLRERLREKRLREKRLREKRLREEKRDEK